MCNSMTLISQAITFLVNISQWKTEIDQSDKQKTCSTINYTQKLLSPFPFVYILQS